VKILILGGSVFVGRYLIEAALARRHEVSVFNRGRHGTDLYPEVEKLRGQREGDLRALRGRRWDAVIDTCGYLPRVVRASAELLSGAVNQYTFISSLSVYADFVPGMDETAPVGTLTEEQLEAAEKIETGDRPTAVTYGALYGPLKASCERAAQVAMSDRALVIRPGLIVGPHDYSDRFAYWVHRVAQGGEVLAPGRPGRQVQFVDVRDLAEWIVRMTEANRTGVFNAQGPDRPLTMLRVLEETRRVSGSDASFTWVSEGFVMESDVLPWTEVPLWVPETHLDAPLPPSVPLRDYQNSRFYDRVTSLRLFLRHLRDIDRKEVLRALAMQRAQPYFDVYGAELITAAMIRALARQVLNVGKAMQSTKAGQKFAGDVERAVQSWREIEDFVEHEDRDIVSKLSELQATGT
jgi:2'-hydroxyisoflavone reductase